ncbi:MAG: TonB-dependent receptor, partial [Gammaproteobacteria bacterium]
MKLFYLGIMIPLSVSQLALAEEVSTLDDVDVFARPYGLQSIEHIAQPIHVLNGEELAKKQASTIGETLENIPGVSTDRFSPLASRPVIRGQSGARVKVLENGISSLDVSTVSVDHAVSIDPLQAEQIEVFRGPAALLYGSEASGGLVNVVTGKIPEYVPDSFSPKLFYSHNTNSNENVYSLNADGGYQKMAFHIDALSRDAQNYESADGTIDNSFYDLENYNFGASFVDDWGFFGMSYGRFNALHGIPANPEEPDELPFIDAQQDRTDLSARILNPFAGIEAISIQGAYNDYLHTEFEGPGEPGTVFSNEQLEGRVEISHAPIGVFNGVIGTQFGYRDFSAAGDEAFVPKTETDTFAIFVLEETDIVENVHFEIGGRYERNEVDDLDNNISASFDLFSISSGIHWHFTEAMALGLNLSRSQRAPTVEELFSNGAHHATGAFERGDASLGEETANNIDLTLARELGLLQWNVSLFANYIEDFIFLQARDINNDGVADIVDEDGNLDPTEEFRDLQFQQDNAIFYGFEIAAGLNLYSGNNGILDLNVFGDYVRAELDGGDNLPRISPARVGASLDYQYNKLTAGLDLTSVLEQNDNAALETETDGYTVLNLNANYKVIEGKQNLNLFAKATNLLDEDGTLHTSFIKDRAPIMG